MHGDTHTHTAFSADCKTNPEDNVRSAIAAGLSSLTFTEHYDFDAPDELHSFDFDVDAYFDTVNSLREKYAGQIRLFAGIEIGQQPHQYVAEATALKMAGRDFDHVIGSTHFIDRLDPYYGGFYKEKTKKQAYDRLLGELLANFKYGYDFDTLGHFDYVTRYGPYEDKTMYYRDHSDLLDELFKYLIREDKALEINTKSGTRVEPDPAILKRYRELGGFLITMGSDAHKPELVGLAFDRFTEYAKSFGFRYCFHYEKRVPVAEPI